MSDGQTVPLVLFGLLMLVMAAFILERRTRK